MAIHYFYRHGMSYEVPACFVGMTASRFYTILTTRDSIGFTNFIVPCLLLVFGAATIRKIVIYLSLL